MNTCQLRYKTKMLDRQVSKYIYTMVNGYIFVFIHFKLLYNCTILSFKIVKCQVWSSFNQ